MFLTLVVSPQSGLPPSKLFLIVYSLLGSKVITVARVMSGGAADRSGLIHVGDEIHEVRFEDQRSTDKPTTKLTRNTSQKNPQTTTTN